MQALEQLFNQVGAFDQIAHEHEERNRDQHVIRHHREGALHHQIECLLHGQIGVATSVGNPGEEHAHPHQGEGGGEAQHDGHHNEGQHQQAQVAVGHVRGGGQHKERCKYHAHHDGQAKINFFFHALVPWDAGAKALSFWMSSSFTLTISFNLATSTSSTSSILGGHSPVCKHTMQRMISTKP